MDKLHCLMFGWEFPPMHSGGLGVACEGLVKGLAKNDVKITLVLPHSGPSNAPFDVRFPTQEIAGAIAVPSLLQPYDSWQSYGQRFQSLRKETGIDELYGPDLGNAVEQFSAMSVELTKDLKPDVIHCHDWMTFGAGVRAGRYHGVPVIAHVHATEYDRTDFKPNPWIAERERWGLQNATGVIAVSRYTKNLLMREYGIPGHKISVVHNGHEHPTIRAKTQLTTHQPHRPMVLFLGRMTVQKNPMLFLDMAKRVREQRPDVTFVMAGDGPMLGSLIDRACQLGLQDAVAFAGKVSHGEAQMLFKRASCFVMPSLSEPFGLVALEAVGHGVPVVLSRQSGASEVIDHCFTVDFWDTDRMADCILTVLREAPLARQMRSEAPRILQRLTWKHQAGIVRDIYNTLVHPHS